MPALFCVFAVICAVSTAVSLLRPAVRQAGVLRGSKPQPELPLLPPLLPGGRTGADRLAAATGTEGPGPASTRIITVTQCPGGCGWTLQYSCPGQPRGSKGPAGDDGTEGYRCCCGAGQPWRAVTRPQPTGETVVVTSKGETDLYIDHGIAITPVANTDEYAPNCCGELLSNGEHRHSNCNHCYNGVPLNRLKKPTGTESKPPPPPPPQGTPRADPTMATAMTVRPSVRRLASTGGGGEIAGNFTWLALQLVAFGETGNPVASRVVGEGLNFALADWIIKQQAVSLASESRRAAPAVDCGDKRYSGALTGKLRGKPHFIVDFVPVGNDLDIVEIRLLESYAVVDVFVLYEASVTPTAFAKPLFLTESMAMTARWERFKDKMLVLVGTDKVLRSEIEATEMMMDTTDNFKSRRKQQKAWELENSMRYKPVELLKLSSDPLARAVLDAPPDAVALQNDGDELATGLALAHLKFCESIAAPPYYMPATMYKGNRWTTEKRVGNFDLNWLGDRWNKNGLDIPVDYIRTLWRPGPTVGLLSDVMNLRDGKGANRGTGKGRYKAGPDWPDFGPGAAVHLSSGADPVQAWLKKMSHVERDPNTAIPELLKEAIARHELTAELINENIVGDPKAWCKHMNHINCHGSPGSDCKAFSARAQELLEAGVPWPLREQPDRYPCWSKFRWIDTHCQIPVCFSDSLVEVVN